ncbi:MAG: hypothetical protein AB8B91_13730 [Rubripirellula sp.]
MPEISLQRVREFNQDLRAIASAGVPVDLGKMHGTVAEKMSQIDAALKERVERGESIEQAIAEAPELPETYRASLGTWLRCDDPTIALDEITAPAFAQQTLGRNLGQALTYPLIVLTLTYVGFLYVCNVMVPTLESFYEQWRMEPSHSLAILTIGRKLMPVWVPLIPLLLVFFAAWWYRSGSRKTWSWLPGAKKYYTSMRSANFARQMSRLMASGCSKEEAIEMAVPLLGNTGGSKPTELPSLLNWAIHGDLAGEPRDRVLRMVAETYRKAADRQSTIWRVAVPAVGGVLLGGAFVFGYGLSLFYPVVALLKDLSIPGGH